VSETYNVGQVAAMTGLTVRALHHYDEIGLVVPTARTAGGYRQYGTEELARLHSVLAYRELGLGLDEIAALLDDDTVDAVERLKDQRRLLTERIDRLRRMRRDVDNELEARAMGITLDPNERFEVFGDSDPTEYAVEVEERWGDTDAYRESNRRTSGYRKQDWQQMKREAEDVLMGVVSARATGSPSDSPQAMDAVEAHRQHVTRWFYHCPPEMHVGLGEMFVADSRFRAYYDAHGVGLAEYVQEAIVANAERQTSSTSP
jgi:DNA-binding transcriptional MerR regulator